MDRVRPVKIESPATGGTEEDLEYTPLETSEDALEARGYYVQEDAGTDETTLISRSGDDMTFTDVNNPVPVTLSSLIGGSGVPASEPGQVLFSVDGSTFTAEIPIVGNGCWLADNEGELIVKG